MEKENKILKTGTGTGTEKQIKENESRREQYRVVIDSETNEMLQEMVDKSNEGFTSGTITKSNFAIYVFQNLKRFISSDDIKNLRAKHFDDRKALTDLLKLSESNVELPEEVRKFLREHSGAFEKDKKRGPKAANSSSEAA